MRRINANFLAIVKLEMEDLREDIEALIEQCTADRERGVVTNYVAMENLALFHNELLGLADFGRILEAADPAIFATLEEMIAHLRTSFRVHIRQSGLAEVVTLYVDRKLEKVRQYVAQAQTTPLAAPAHRDRAHA
ncbi:MAG: hypothetical protein AB1505_31330 [Candidatus Latescibacterota bacterium]